MRNGKKERKKKRVTKKKVEENVYRSAGKKKEEHCIGQANGCAGRFIFIYTHTDIQEKNRHHT